jgi:chromosome segregation protein
VVGPNGCGKSNIVDAIRWVMGEQRAKQLRSAKMEDVIFSGTEDRPPMNMAEVSLIINNDKGLLPSDYSEIQITRRAFRNGDSEYLINNQECRLKDIHNLFYDTGMGAASYSLMEQKMIDALLSDKAEERRALFEEASGISKYKQQRKETLRQLERTALDLQRVEDNLRHTRQSVHQFERQAKKAEEWRAIQNRLKDLDVSLSYDRFFDYQDNFEKIHRQRNEKSKEMDAQQTRLTLIETDLQERKLGMAEEENTYREFENQVVEANLEVNNLNNEARRLNDLKRMLRENIDKYDEEIQRGQEELNVISQKREEVIPEQATLAQKQEFLQSEIQNLKTHRDEIRLLFEASREKSHTLSSERVALLESFNDRRSKYDRGNQEIGHLESRRLEWSREIESLESELSQLRERSELLNQEVDSLTQNRTQLEQQSEALRGEHSGVQSHYLELQAQEREAEGKKIFLASRLEVLQNMAASGAGVGEGTRVLLAERSTQIKGLLADRLQTDNRYLGQIEYCMGDTMQTLLIDSKEELWSILEFLDQGEKGKAILGIPALFRQGASATRPDIQHSGGIGYASDCVQTDDSIRPLIYKLLNKYYLTENFETALELAEQFAHQDIWFVAPEMRAVHTSGLIKGGRGAGDASSGLLRRKNEIEDLAKNLQEARQKLEAISEERIKFEARSSELAEQLQEINDKLKQCSLILGEKSGSLELARRRLEDTEINCEKRSISLRDADEKLHLLRQSLSGGDEELTEAESRKKELEDNYNRELESIRRIEHDLSAADDAYRNAENEKHQIRLRLDQIALLLTTWSEKEASLKGMLERRSQEISTGNLEISQTDTKLEALYDQIEKRNESFSVLEQKRDEAKEIYDSKASQLEGLQQEIRQINSQMHQLQSEVHNLEMKESAQKTNSERIRERILEAYEIDLEKKDTLSLIEYDESTAESELRDLKAKQKKLGNINPGALEDYEAEKARLQDVEKQFDDLDKARISLEKTIRKLDKLARERFHETFRQIQKNFQDVFSSLMIGGEARLSLEEGVDPLEGKIEINARPTGKKMRGVALLSGGERALTATALLFALYMVKPSPYCILDEVDGPLDDANIGRFVQLLRRFSRQTQFIIVTHNKRTMAASDRLYGVTQEIKGISRIASVQLDEASDFVQ